MLKAGVLGAGHLGKIHLKLLKLSKNYELVGFYDTSKEVRDAISRALFCPLEQADVRNNNLMNKYILI